MLRPEVSTGAKLFRELLGLALVSRTWRSAALQVLEEAREGEDALTLCPRTSLRDEQSDWTRNR